MKFKAIMNKIWDKLFSFCITVLAIGVIASPLAIIGYSIYWVYLLFQHEELSFDNKIFLIAFPIGLLLIIVFGMFIAMIAPIIFGTKTKKK